MKRLFFRKFWPIFLFVFSQVLWAQDLEHLESAPDPTGRIKQLKIKSLSDLQRLTPYESVSVIQKRYLPKTFRGEFNLSASFVINHTFFYLGGLSAWAGFFIREDHGFGLEGSAFLPAVNKLVTNEMISPPNKTYPSADVFSQFYGGAYYKWSPIFGKFAVLNKKIIYFDMYMTFGAGVSRVIKGLDDKTLENLKFTKPPPQLVKNVVPTISLGLGQMFAINQSWAFNWDLKLLYTIAEYQNQNQKEYYDPFLAINLSLGINYYFPGAGYR